jgi:hypothetical protein
MLILEEIERLKKWMMKSREPHILAAPASLLSEEDFKNLRAALESRPEHNRSTCEYCPHCGEKTSSPSAHPPQGGLNYDYVSIHNWPSTCPTYTGTLCR